MGEVVRRDAEERAKTIYEARIQALVEKEHVERVLSINVNSGDYEVARDDADEIPTLRRLRARNANPQAFDPRIGYRRSGACERR